MHSACTRVYTRTHKHEYIYMERETDRLTDRQRQTDRLTETDRQTDKQRQRHRERGRDRQLIGC